MTKAYAMDTTNINSDEIPGSHNEPRSTAWSDRLNAKIQISYPG